MLRFFKSTLPTRLAALLLLFFAVRLPLLWLGIPLTMVELRALLVGERLHAGAFPYRDLYDSTAPLAALLFAGLDALASRPLWLHRALAMALLLFQALRLNAVLNRADVHPERGFLVALTYLLLASSTSDLDRLSPLLVGHTFLVMAFSSLLPTSREGYDNRRLFRAGFLIGLAALCYLPLALFVLVGLFAVIVFAANSFRSFLLLLCGFFFPYAVAVTLFMYSESLPEFVRCHLQPAIRNLLPATDNLPLFVQLRALVLPGVVLLLALARAFTTTLGLVFQTKFQQLMLVWLVVAGLMVVAGRGVAPGTLVLVLPPLTYFSLFLWQKAQRPWLPELLLILVLGSVMAVRYRHVLPLGHLIPIPDEQRYALQPNAMYRPLRGHRLLVLGTDWQPYLTNESATPYLDWQLSQRDFGHLGEYAAIYRLARNVAPAPPEYIIDESGLLPELRYKLPGVFGAYEPTDLPKVYRRH